MQRKLIDDLLAWKNSPRRKPLVLEGARQVGKTWLLREFGRTQFANTAYVSLDLDTRAQDIFQYSTSVQELITRLAAHCNTQISAGSTLLIIDEIQECPRALTWLKYFCEDAPEYAVAAAGSLLGLVEHAGSGWPVGKVDSLRLFPLNFQEFLAACNEQFYVDLLQSGHVEGEDGASRLGELLKHYYVVGGMPAAVLAYLEAGRPQDARSVQNRILGDYARDFSKHIPHQILANTILAWDSVPAHLGQENKKFVFGRVRSGARAKDFEQALRWLQEAGLVHVTPRVKKPGQPLMAYQDHKTFKVFALDVGLLGAMSGLDPSVALEGSRAFTEFKGALVEQYVCQELASCGLSAFYWTAENSSGEVDFLVAASGETYAIEVKAEENLRSKSLRAFKLKYPEVKARRFSMSGFRQQDWMQNVPLWAVGAQNCWL